MAVHSERKNQRPLLQFDSQITFEKNLLLCTRTFNFWQGKKKNEYYVLSTHQKNDINAVALCAREEFKIIVYW